MIRNAFRELRLHPGRFAAVLTAIALSIGFLTAVQVFVATEQDATGKREVIHTTNADVVVAGSFTDPAQVTTTLRSAPGVAAVDAVSMATSGATANGRDAVIKVFSIPADEAMRWAKVRSGALPTTDSQIALARKTADSLDVGVGGTVRLGAGADAPSYTVSALVDEPGLFLLPAYATTDGVRRLAGPEGGTNQEWIVRVADTTQAAAVADDLRDRVRPLQTDIKADPVASTAQVARDKAVKEMAQGFDVMRNMLLVFGAIALLVGSIIIANTFAILVAQRRRQTGLLRAVGASRGQVFRRFLAEAFALGLVGSVLGVALGIALAAVPSSNLLTGSLRFGLVLPWSGLALTLLIGVAVTMLASLLPLRRALRVAPLEALRPVESVESARRGGLVRLVLTLALMGGGLAVALLALRRHDNAILVAIAGSILFTLGVLGAAPLYVPVLLRALGSLLGFSPTARLAATNAARNPGRAGATATALMLAVGLIVTLGVGSATLKRTMNEELDKSYPIALSVSQGMTFDRQTGTPHVNPSLPAGLVDKVRAVPGVSGAVATRATQQLVVGFQNHEIAGGWGDLLAALTPSLDPVLPERVTLADDEILVHPDYLEGLKITDGARLDVAFGKAGLEMPQPGQEPPAPVTRSMVVRASKLAGEQFFVTEKTLLELDPQAGENLIIASVADRTKAAQLTSDLRRVVQEAAPGAAVGGALFMRAIIGQVLDYMLLVTSGLLGVAALIALVGVGNTLSLSVLERTRESALLRALGLQARSLRWMLLIEALLLAAVATVVGIAAGCFFGWLGASAVMREMKLPGSPLFEVNALQLVVVVLVAALAAVLASILPGRKAARATPVEALADVG